MAPPHLPIEVIIYHVLPYLNSLDLLNVCRALNLPATHETYERIFGDRASIHHFDIDKRFNARLFVLGNAKDMHFSLQHNSTSKYFENTKYGVRTMSPVPVTVEQGGVLGVYTEGELKVIDSKGGVYYGGSLQNEGFRLTRLKSAKGHSVVDVSGKDSEQLMLDRFGQLWYGTEKCLREVGLVDDEGRPIRGRVRKLGTLRSLWVDGWGVGTWTFPQMCKSKRPITIEVRKRPQTQRYIKDWSGHIYLKTDGSMFADTSGYAKLEEYGPFAQLCRDHRFGVAYITKKGNAVFLDKRGDVDTSVLKGLEIASVAVGAQHCLALTRDGEVYSWGRENHSNGCLGLGSLNEALKKGAVVGQWDELRLEKPTKLELPGKAYAVFAGYDYSVILMDDKEDPCRKSSDPLGQLVRRFSRLWARKQEV